MIISLHPQTPQPRNVLKAVGILSAGGVIAYPTDTMFGIGCDARSPKSIEMLSRITGRDKKTNFSFICRDFSQVDEYARVSKMAFRIMRHALPGPYTFILPATSLVPKKITKKRKTVGIRIPDNAICHALVTELGSPLANTSAEFGENIWTGDAYSIDENIGNRIDAVIDGGLCETAHSTVVDLTGEGPKVLRQGKGETSFLE